MKPIQTIKAYYYHTVYRRAMKRREAASNLYYSNEFISPYQREKPKPFTVKEIAGLILYVAFFLSLILWFVCGGQVLMMEGI